MTTPTDKESASLSGMTINERLSTLGLVDEFDLAARRRERSVMVDLLRKAQLTESDAISCADTILSDPQKYGF